MAEITTENYTVKYPDDEATKQAVFDRVIKYFVENEAFAGEVIMQADDPIIDAPNVLSEIADDIIKFEVEYIDA